MYVGVGLHLHLCLSPLEAVFLIAWDKVVEEQGVGTLGTIFRQEAYKQQVYTLSLVELDGPEHVPPSKREETATMAFLQGFGKRGNGDAQSGQFVALIAVLDYRDEIEVCQLEIHVDILVYLPMRQFRETIEVLVGFID